MVYGEATCAHNVVVLIFRRVVKMRQF